MLGLITFGALLLATLIQAVVRKGPLVAGAAPPTLQKTAKALLLLGATASIAPLVPLAFDLVSVKSASELLTLILFLVLSLALILPAWIWIFVASKRSAERPMSAFVIAVSVANTVIAITLYQGLVSGNADSQDGIVVQLVPLMQIIVTAASAFIKRGMGLSLDGARLRDKA